MGGYCGAYRQHRHRQPVFCVSQTLRERFGFDLLAAVLSFLVLINTALALFNLVPAFPLDGGRILRSIIWWRTGNLKRATRIASTCGSIFGMVLMAWGGAQLFAGNAAAGTWQLLIGIFLTIAASQARSGTETAESLKGVAVSDLMDRTPITAPPGITVETLVKDYIYRLSRRFVIVAEDGHALGYIGPDQIKRVPQTEWQDTFIQAIAAPFTHNTVANPASSALDALRKLRTNGIGYLAVLDSSQLVGSVSEINFANYLSVREEFTRTSSRRRRDKVSLSRQHPVHFANEVFQVDGLGENARLFRRFAEGLQSHCGKARNEHDLHIRIELCGALGKLDAVHFRHHDIR